MLGKSLFGNQKLIFQTDTIVVFGGSKDWDGFFWKLAVLETSCTLNAPVSEIRHGSHSRLRLHNIIVLHMLALQWILSHLEKDMGWLTPGGSQVQVLQGTGGGIDP